MRYPNMRRCVHPLALVLVLLASTLSAPQEAAAAAEDVVTMDHTGPMADAPIEDSPMAFEVDPGAGEDVATLPEEEATPTPDDTTSIDSSESLEFGAGGDDGAC